MLTWMGKPLTRRRDADATARLQRHFEILADVAALPPRAFWPTLDAILALPETSDCCPLEWVGDED